jgi:transcriptional regulator with XRE-family HTH domain
LEKLGISQSKLARMSGVSRLKICTYELGSSLLTTAEQGRIHESLQAEADRLRNIRVLGGLGEFLQAQWLIT